jgi:hypothetical protein
VSPAVVGQQAQEDFAAEALTTVTPPTPSAAPDLALPPTSHGACVNCGRRVTLRRVATDHTHHTYQWVPDDEPVRPGKQCSEAAMPAYHWALDATAAVYRVST